MNPTWDCPDCLVVNLADDKECRLCHTPKPKEEEDPPAMTGTLDFYIYNRESFEDCNTAYNSGALYDLVTVNGITRDSYTQVAESFAGAKTAQECLGTGDLRLVVQIPEGEHLVEIVDLEKFFKQSGANDDDSTAV